MELWDLESGVCVQIIKTPSERVEAVAISANGLRAITASFDETLRVWNLESGECVQSMNCQESPGRRTPGPLATLLAGSSRGSYWVVALSLSADGRIALVGCADTTMMVWDTITGEHLRTLPASTGDEILSSVALSRDGRIAVSGGRFRTSNVALRVWDLEAPLIRQAVEGQFNGVRCVALSESASLAVSGSDDATLKAWSLKTGESLGAHSTGQWLRRSNGRCIERGWADCRLLVLTVSQNWDAINGRCLAALAGHARSQRWVLVWMCIAISGSDDKMVRIWSLRTGDCLYTRYHSRINAVTGRTDHWQYLGIQWYAERVGGATVLPLS
jgi:WD40 repeat protein